MKINGETEQESPQALSSNLYVAGGGMSGMMFAYYALENARKTDQGITIKIVEAEDAPASRRMANDENAHLGMASSGGLAASLTWIEAQSVADYASADAFEEALRVDATQYGLGVDAIKARSYLDKAHAFFTQTSSAYRQEADDILAEAGKRSMQLWDELYQSDPEIRAILDEAGYESGQTNLKLHIIHASKKSDPAAYAAQSADLYNIRMHENPNAKVMSPEEVLAHDPSLEQFVEQYTQINAEGQRVWLDNISVAALHGGGLIPEIFLPRFQKYLEDKAAAQGSSLTMVANTRLSGISFGANSNDATGLDLTHQFDGASRVSLQPEDKLVIASGGHYNLPKALGLDHPEMAGFAGVSLVLDLPPGMVADYESHNGALPRKAMVLYFGTNTSFKPVAGADGSLHIGIGGIKAFYGDKRPDFTQDFTRWAVTEHLKTINTLYPQLLAHLLGHAKPNEALSYDDVQVLADKGFARIWAGSRPMAYDFTPVIGQALRNEQSVSNVFYFTAMGSGGIASGPAAAKTAANLVQYTGFDGEDALRRYADISNPARPYNQATFG